MYLSSFSSCANYLFNEYAFYIFVVKLNQWKIQSENYKLPPDCDFEKVS